MGIVHAEVKLRNAMDVGNAKRGLIDESEIRETTVTAVVDTGAETMVINEAIREELGLEIAGDYQAWLANGEDHLYSMSESVEVQYKNRRMSCEAIIIPTAKEILLGAIPLQAMDLIVHPSRHELIGAHGDRPMGRVYGRI